jgi:hypothetical protein
MSTSYSNTLALSRLQREGPRGTQHRTNKQLVQHGSHGTPLGPALNESQDPWHGVKRSNVEATQPLSAPPKALDLREAIPARGDRLQLEIAPFRWSGISSSKSRLTRDGGALPIVFAFNRAGDGSSSNDDDDDECHDTLLSSSDGSDSGNSDDDKHDQALQVVKILVEAYPRISTDRNACRPLHEAFIDRPFPDPQRRPLRFGLVSRGRGRARRVRVPADQSTWRSSRRTTRRPLRNVCAKCRPVPLAGRSP